MAFVYFLNKQHYNIYTQYFYRRDMIVLKALLNSQPANIRLTGCRLIE